MTSVHWMVLGVMSVSALSPSMSLLRGGRSIVSRVQAGDVARGRTVVESSGCFDCHRIDDRGSRVGPNLTDVGGRRTPEILRLSLVAPDDDVQPENRSVRIVTRDGTAVTGRLLNQDSFSVQLLTAKEELKTYAKDGLREFTILDKGLMPASKMTDQQLADVVAYLGSLKAP